MTETITIIGFIQALFGVLMFLTKKPKHFSFIVLTVWLAIIAVFLGAMLLPFQVVDYFKPGIFPILFLWGPLLYIYVGSLTVDNFKLNKKSLLHFIPLVMVGIHRSIVDVVSVTDTIINGQATDFVYNKIYYVLLGISLFVYWLFSLKLILKHRKNIPYFFSNYNSKNTLSWLIFMVSLFLVFFLLEFFVPYFEKILGNNFGGAQMLSLNLTVFAFIMVFFGINQSAIYENNKEKIGLPKTDNTKKPPTDKYKRSALSKTEIDEVTALIFAYLNDKKPYLNPDFSLQMMANDLAVSRQKLSQAINSGQQKNFYKIINQFRIKEVKQLLVNSTYQHYTVLGIAFECGFNSKTSFNRIFKEETGLTPTAYKNSL